MRTIGRALLLVTAAAALSGSITSAYLARQTARPALVCDEPTQDFGELPQGETVRTTFELVNRHQREINIVHVATSCDCSDYELSERVIRAGDSVTLSATWRIGSHRDHSTTALLVLYSVDEQPPETLRLELVANVRPDFRVDPSSIRFRAGMSGVASVAIAPGRLDKVRLRQAYATHRAFTVKTNLEEGRVELAFDPSVWPGGDVPAELVLETDSAHEPRHGVEIRVE